MLRARRLKKGFTLVEVLISIVIFAVGITGGMAFFLYLKEVAVHAGHEKVAVHLAGSKMEQLRNGTLTSNTDSVTIGNFIWRRSWSVGSGGTGYNRVDVSVSWREGGKPQDDTVSLTTYIAQ